MLSKSRGRFVCQVANIFFKSKKLSHSRLEIVFSLITLRYKCKGNYTCTLSIVNIIMV